MIEIWKRRRDWNDGGNSRKTCFAEKGVLGWNMVKLEDELWAECRDFQGRWHYGKEMERERKMEAGHEGICGWNGEI